MITVIVDDNDDCIKALSADRCIRDEACLDIIVCIRAIPWNGRASERPAVQTVPRLILDVQKVVAVLELEFEPMDA